MAESRGEHRGSAPRGPAEAAFRLRGLVAVIVCLMVFDVTTGLTYPLLALILGEHSREALAEIGYAEAEIERLIREAAVVAAPAQTPPRRPAVAETGVTRLRFRLERFRLGRNRSRLRMQPAGSPVRPRRRGPSGPLP